jgi:lipoyl(octanoyl) transferase
MSLVPSCHAASVAADVPLQVYLLGTMDFEAAQAFQKRLLFQAAGDRHNSYLVICEHPPLITVGREGSRTHIRCEPDELRTRRWSVRWVNRGGGCLLHLPGQMAVYPVLALDHWHLSLPEYLNRLHQVLIALLDDFHIAARPRAEQSGLWVGARMIAGVGVAVWDWVTYYGAYLNVNPDLEPYRRIRSANSDDGAMTSLERERRGPLRSSLVRQRLVEHFAAQFEFSRTAVFFDHPSLSRKAPSDAVAANP